MKQLFKNIWNFVKQYPFTFIVMVIFLLLTIQTIGTFFDGNIPTKFCLLTAIPFFIYIIVIYCWQRFMKNKNRYVQGIILFLVNCIFLYSSAYFSGELLLMFSKTIKTPDTYVEFVSKGIGYINWEQFGEGLYLNIDNICYYNDKDGNRHALITEKHMKDKYNDFTDKITIKYFNKPFHYVYIVQDINLDQKKETLLHISFYNQGSRIGGINFDKDNPENTISLSTDSKIPIGRIYQYIISNSNSN